MEGRILSPIILVLFSLLSWALISINLKPELRELPIPVKNASPAHWDKLSYWYYPWGKSRTHKGIDIFSPHKTPVISPVNGLIVKAGYSANGGNYLYLLGPKMRVFYFAHLNSLNSGTFSIVKKYQLLGTVGNTGNAISKPYHLHFSIFSLLPVIRHYDQKAPDGWKKMFNLDPGKLLIN
ncbi:MAG TPA: M23 family metallopeptidase [Sphingobacteriaceae bacterium]|nr:M23 family metallopeptidase [Sphingobacteriaceae bacterium]